MDKLVEISSVLWDMYLEGKIVNLHDELCKFDNIPETCISEYYLKALAYIKLNVDSLGMPISDFEKIFDFQLSYDGRYPNLCSGELIIFIDHVSIKFPQYCLSSGGFVRFDEEWNETVGKGPWSISDWVDWPESLPKGLHTYVLEKVNEQVKHGCCGGCV